MIRAVAVVVPAHDEEELLSACLESVRRAALHPALRGLRVEAVVVADSCRDATAGAGRAGGTHVVEADVRSAGAARALGTAHALRRLTAAGAGKDQSALSDPTGLSGLSGLSADEVWLAHTDADSRVPRR
ncbi:hypothetical protein ACWGJ2_32025 [Streptomyces sp. NPDC054796]